jgi:hypothetical protein
MRVRHVLTLIVLACAGVLTAVLIGHLWDRHAQVAGAWEFGRTYERYLGSLAGSADDTVAGGLSAGHVREASALEE